MCSSNLSVFSMQRSSEFLMASEFLIACKFVPQKLHQIFYFKKPTENNSFYITIAVIKITMYYKTNKKLQFLVDYS